MGLIVVSGAGGRLGRRVVERMSGPLRMLVRNAGRAPEKAGAEVAVAEYRDGAAVTKALTGAETVLMVSAAETPDRVDEHRSFVDAAVMAGVGHLVYTSFVGASPDATFTLARDHWATEQHIRDSGLAFTFLRDNLYADFMRFLVGEDGVIRGPAGDGRAAVVAQDDIADVITTVLREPGAHAGRTYDLTGPAAVSLAEVAAIVGASTGRDVRFHNESIPEAYASRSPFGAPDWQVDAWVSTYTAIAAGELATVSTAVEELTGHPATSLAELLEREPA
ncbi:SDR family oxidoreductase [Actinoplanes sp. LDG1-06]|uniref:SDR family oxidoreductase n=1 Tax=Paractinoplanes ovalisporus TaxID=2810368 RepID=A0ABS2ASM0_9ACTN|nr:SDR family oxidoreductase [Actinoplanes ovalisporus]MBM2622875.1 SDR family oxidoreductase [Actinoplanes ovalisporus]